MTQSFRITIFLTSPVAMKPTQSTGDATSNAGGDTLNERKTLKRRRRVVCSSNPSLRREANDMYSNFQMIRLWANHPYNSKKEDLLQNCWPTKLPSTTRHPSRAHQSKARLPIHPQSGNTAITKPCATRVPSKCTAATQNIETRTRPDEGTETAGPGSHARILVHGPVAAPVSIWRISWSKP